MIIIYINNLNTLILTINELNFILDNYKALNYLFVIKCRDKIVKE
jgi:hypothetical protein